MPYPLTAEDEISSKGVFNVWIIFGEDGLIDAGVRLAKINLPLHSILVQPSRCIRPMGDVRVEWIGDATEGSAYGTLDYCSEDSRKNISLTRGYRNDLPSRR